MHSRHLKGKHQKASTTAKPSSKITVDIHSYQQPAKERFKRLIRLLKIIVTISKDVRVIYCCGLGILL